MFGLALISFNVLIYIFAVEPHQTKITTLLNETISPVPTLPTQSELQPTSTSAEQLTDFHSRFLTLSDLSPQMSKFYQAASDQGLILDQAEYHLIPAQDTQLSTYQIAVPVRSDYKTLRKFIAQALHDIPALSLDSVTFTQQTTGDYYLEAQLRFSLYLQTT